MTAKSDAEFITAVPARKGKLYYLVSERIPGGIVYDGLGHFMVVATLKYSKTWDKISKVCLYEHEWGWIIDHKVFCSCIKDVTIENIPEVMAQGKDTSDLFKQAWKEFSEQIRGLKVHSPNIAYIHMGFDYSTDGIPQTPCYCPLCTVSPLTTQSGVEGMNKTPNSLANNDDEIFMEMLYFKREIE